MIALMLLMACGEAPSTEVAEAPTAAVRASGGPWTVEAALIPTLEALDSSSDGRVVAAEYRPVQGAAPGFSAVDLDGDGELSISELRSLSEGLDPQTWDGNKPRRPVAVEVWRGHFAGELPVRQLSELMRFVRSEIEALAPTLSLPSDAQIQAAAETKDLESEAVRAVFEELKRARESAGSTL